LRRRVNRHSENVRDGFVFVFDLERFDIVASAMAGGARGVDTREEQQLDANEALNFAGFAAARGDVERKTTRAIVTGTSGFGSGEELTNVIEESRVGG
jgi:hypothetical protein